MDSTNDLFYKFWIQELSLKAQRDMKNSIDFAREEGERIGRLEGERIGRLKAELEGRLEGRLKAKREIAKNLLAESEPIERIMRITGLSKDEIEKLG